LKIFDRLVGQETEYAIRYSRDGDEPHPGNDVIYEALTEAIQSLVLVRKGERALARRQYFVQNGGAFYYESLPTSSAGGLLEGATPECRGPAQTLLYQRALDGLLIDALPIARRILTRKGFPGRIGLLKNCRDAEGHVYGAQENYEAVFATGVTLWAWRALLIAMFPLLMVCVAVTWTLLVGMMAWLFTGIVMGWFLMVLLPHRFDPTFVALATDDTTSTFDAIEGPMSLVFMWVEIVVWWPVVTLLGWAIATLGFRKVHQSAMGFLISRPIVSGAGTVDTHSLFGLSEKGPATRTISRTSVLPDARGIFDAGNLMKHAINTVQMDFSSYFRLFRRRQRLQFGLSDSNLCQMAEYLKLGTTLLVIDMAEAGALDHLPRPTEPIISLHQLIADPTLQAAVPMSDGSMMTALQLQRLTLDTARDFLDRHDDVPTEARRVVRLWEEVLDALEEDPARLVGRLDWVTKRYVLESVAPNAPLAVQKKIDLRYHELGEGYLGVLEAHGEAVELVEAGDVLRARTEAPQNTPARLRAELMTTWGDQDVPVAFSWSSVRIGGWFNARVIPLDGDSPRPPPREQQH